MYRLHNNDVSVLATMTEITGKQHSIVFIMLWDVIKTSRIYQKHKYFTTGIICATLSLGVVCFVRKYGGNALRKIKKVTACTDKVVVVSSLAECEIVAGTLQRLVVDCRADYFLCMHEV